MKILVFGAAGHVGRAVCKRLINEGHDVLALRKTSGHITGLEGCKNDYYDVTTGSHGLLISEHLVFKRSFDAIVYCVGHCPPGGFAEAISRPISDFPISEMEREIGMHALGPFNVFQKFLPGMKDNGRFVFLSSAATRILEMPLAERPSIHIYHHLGVIRAQDAFIEGMRADPVVKKRGITIHKIAPPRITDSPFHSTDSEIPAGSKSPKGVTTADVVTEIFICLISTTNEHTDKDMFDQNDDES